MAAPAWAGGREGGADGGAAAAGGGGGGDGGARGERPGGRLAALPTPAAQPVQRRGRPQVPDSLVNTRCVLASHRQRGNPVLQHIHNIRWVYADIVPDYVLGESTCALFISLRYHALHRGYLTSRMHELADAFRTRIVLCYADSEDGSAALEEITGLCVQRGFSLIVCWSPQEAARYLETFKLYEKKPADAIMTRVEGDFHSKVEAFLTCVKTINKTDAHMLLQAFGTVAKIISAEPAEWAAVPGIGPTKVKMLTEAFHKPLKRQAQQPPPQQGLGQQAQRGQQAQQGQQGQQGQQAQQGQSRQATPPLTTQQTYDLQRFEPSGSWR